MKTTGIFETAAYPMKFKGFNDWQKIVPVGDVHFGSPAHAEQEFDAFCQQYRNDKGAHFLGMGDYMDLASSSERYALMASQLHESTESKFDAMAYAETERFAKKIEFMRGRCIGFIEGNHYYRFTYNDEHGRFACGETTTQVLARMLGAPYLGVYAIVLFQCEVGGACMPVYAVAYHGKGGGQLAGSPFNTIEKMIFAVPSARMFFQGHDHSLGAVPVSRLAPYYDTKNGVVAIRDERAYLVRTGSFLYGYLKGKRGYVTDTAKNPKPLGATEILIRLHRTKESGKQILHCQLKGVA